jgi:hypothetical protein
MTPLDAALSYAGMGLYVFPCNGKQPLVQWGTESTTDPEMLHKWWTTWPSAGIGVDCGKSGLVVIDLDVKSDADGPGNWRQRLNGHQIPATFNVRTPSGGWHGWYRDPTGRYRNSAGLIAPGVDVRGVGGYVLAPGSPGYRWHTEAPIGLGDIPALPDGIIPATAAGSVGHWSKLDRAELDPRDLAALEALERLNGHGAYQSGDYIAITRPGKSAGASATIGHIGPGIARVFTSNWPKLHEGVYDADQLVTLSKDDEVAVDRFGHLYLPRSALVDLPRGDPLIEGVIDRHTLFVVAGRDQSYKSFLVLDWLLSLATGHTWLGRATQRCKVLYVVGEGAWGLNDRVAAWEAAWQQDVDDDWFHVRRAPVNLFRQTDAYADLVDRITTAGYEVVVFDTLQRMASGADQNAAKDAGVIISSLDRIRQTIGAGAVGVVAHTDKGDNDTRGSSAFEDDADIVWRVKRDPDEEIVRALLDKRKDGPAGLTIELQPRVISGTGSLVLEHASRLTLDIDRKPPAHAWRVLEELAKPVFLDDGASSTALAEVLDLKGKGSIVNALNYLLGIGCVQNASKGKFLRYKITSIGASKLSERHENALTSENVVRVQRVQTRPTTRPSPSDTTRPNASNNLPYVVGELDTLDASDTWMRWPSESEGAEPA